MDSGRRNAPRRRKQFCLSGCLPHSKLTSLVAASDSSPVNTRRGTADPEKCVDLACRIGGCCHHLRRPHSQAPPRHSTEAFRYDASSYALNFDGGGGDEFPLRSFISRLPPSPPPPPENALASCG